MEIKELNYEEVNAVIDEILDSLATQQENFCGEKKKVSLALIKDGVIYGGAVGSLLYQGFHISGLAVPEQLRGQGYGSKLMRAIEEVAISLGAKTITVNTQNYEAADFYPKLGYQLFATLDDWPIVGGVKHYFYKKV